MQDIDQQVIHLEGSITQQEQSIAQIEAELAELHQEISEFEQRYDRVVRPAAEKLDAARKAVQELEALIRQRAAGGEKPLESLWRGPAMPPSAIPPHTLFEHHEPIFTESTAGRRSGEKLKRLYRRLARLYHPDLAAHPEDREHRTQLMILINQAYNDNDVEALMLLEQTPSNQNHASRLSLSLLKLRRLQRLTRELAERLDELKMQRSALLHSEMMDLKIKEKLARMKGRDLLQEMASGMEAEYWDEIRRLDRLRAGLSSSG